MRVGFQPRMARPPAASELQTTRCENRRRHPLGTRQGRMQAAPSLPSCREIPKQMLTTTQGNRRSNGGRRAW